MGSRVAEPGPLPPREWGALHFPFAAVSPGPSIRGVMKAPAASRAHRDGSTARAGSQGARLGGRAGGSALSVAARGVQTLCVTVRHSRKVEDARSGRSRDTVSGGRHAG